MYVSPTSQGVFVSVVCRTPPSTHPAGRVCEESSCLARLQEVVNNIDMHQFFKTLDIPSEALDLFEHITAPPTAESDLADTGDFT